MSNGTRRCKRRNCEKEFKPKTPWQKFCTVACADIDRHRRERQRVRALKKILNGNK